MEIKKLNTAEAITYIMDMIPLTNVARVMGVLPVVLSQARKHAIINGKPYYMPEDKVKRLGDAVREIGEDLLKERLSHDIDCADELKLIQSNYINLKYMVTQIMGKSYPWIKQRIGNVTYKDRYGKPRNYYNHFTDKDINGINTAIRTIALNLLSIEIVPDYPEGCAPVGVPTVATKEENSTSMQPEVSDLLADEMEWGLL